MSSVSPKNSIPPPFWGPYFWKVIHLTAYAYPDNPTKVDKENYQTFYVSLMKVLPCDTCSEDAQREIIKTDWDKTLLNRENLLKWTYNFHDTVNKKLEKTSPTFEDFTNNILKSPEPPKDNTSFYICTIIILILIILYMCIR